MGPKRQKVGGEGTSRQGRQHLSREAARQSRSEDPEVPPGLPTDPEVLAPVDSDVPERLPTFRSRDHRYRFHNDLIGRKMTSLFFLDFSMFTSTPGLEFVDWVRNAGLEPLVSFREVGYLDTVREFYANLDIVYDSGAPVSLSSRVDGFDVSLTVAEFRDLF